MNLGRQVCLLISESIWLWLSRSSQLHISLSHRAKLHAGPAWANQLAWRCGLVSVPGFSLHQDSGTDEFYNFILFWSSGLWCEPGTLSRTTSPPSLSPGVSGLKVLPSIPSPKAEDPATWRYSPMANLYLPGSQPCLILNFPPNNTTPSCWDIKPVTSSILSVAISMHVPTS